MIPPWLLMAQVRAPELFNPLFRRHGVDAVLVDTAEGFHCLAHVALPMPPMLLAPANTYCSPRLEKSNSLPITTFTLPFKSLARIATAGG